MATLKVMVTTLGIYNQSKTTANNKNMRTITTTKTVYSFNELSERSKEKALENLYDINVDYDWWEFVDEDAKNIGLKITSFDIYHKDISGELYEYVDTIAENILKNHGEQTETYKLAKTYLEELSILQEQFEPLNERHYSHDEEDYLTEQEYQQYRSLEKDIEHLNEQFKNDLLNEYLSMLQQEYDYLTSSEAIIETIEANEYEFDEDGNLI